MPTTKTLCSIAACILIGVIVACILIRVIVACILIMVIAACILIRVILMVSVDTHSKYLPFFRTI